MMMQHEKAEDFVSATGETHSVRDFAEKAFSCLGIEIDWRGAGEQEKGVVASINKDLLSEKTRAGKQFVKINDTVVKVS